MPSKRPPLKKQKAAIGWLADAETSTKTLSNVGQDVIGRVRKCFARANHENANEAEARAAFKMASKIMEQHKISQADLMEAEDKTAREKRGGMSTVAIWPPKLTEKEKDNGKEESQVIMQGWVHWLIGAMEKFFDCRAYSTQLHTEIEWTFYGIAEHTISAAIAFEAIHNQIQDWSEKYTGVSTRNSYCLGVADGLLQLAAEEIKRNEKQAREYEAKALAARIREEDIKRQVELDKLRMPPPKDPTPDLVHDDDDLQDFEDDDDDGGGHSGDFTGNSGLGAEHEAQPDFHEDRNNPLAQARVDTAADFDTELQNFVVPESTTNNLKSNLPSRNDFLDDDDDTALPSTEPAEDQVPELEETPEWKSMRQLTTFREMSKDIEESVLAEKKVKLSKAKKTKKSIKDKDAFKQGVKDSEKIEVRAPRIEEGKEDSDHEAGGSSTPAKRSAPASSDRLPIREAKKPKVVGKAKAKKKSEPEKQPRVDDADDFSDDEGGCKPS